MCSTFAIPSGYLSILSNFAGYYVLPLSISATSHTTKYLEPTVNWYYQTSRHFNTSNTLCLLRLGGSDRSIADRPRTQASEDFCQPISEHCGLVRHETQLPYSDLSPTSPPPSHPPSHSTSLSVAYSAGDGPDNFRFVHR